MKPHIEMLRKSRACDEAVVWARQFETLQDLWDDCKRGDWMVWLVRRGIKDKKHFQRFAKECIALAKTYDRSKITAQLQGKFDEWIAKEGVAEADDATEANDAAEFIYNICKPQNDDGAFNKFAILIRRYYPKAPTLENT